MRTRNAAVLAAALLFGATIAAGAQPYQPYRSPPNADATPPAAPSVQTAAPQWDYSRLGPSTDTPRYDYPGPALIGGSNGGGGGGGM